MTNEEPQHSNEGSNTSSTVAVEIASDASVGEGGCFAGPKIVVESRSKIDVDA